MDDSVTHFGMTIAPTLLSSKWRLRSPVWTMFTAVNIIRMRYSDGRTFWSKVIDMTEGFNQLIAVECTAIELSSDVVTTLMEIGWVEELAGVIQLRVPTVENDTIALVISAVNRFAVVDGGEMITGRLSLKALNEAWSFARLLNPLIGMYVYNNGVTCVYRGRYRWGSVNPYPVMPPAMVNQIESIHLVEYASSFISDFKIRMGVRGFKDFITAMAWKIGVKIRMSGHMENLLLYGSDSLFEQYLSEIAAKAETSTLREFIGSMAPLEGGMEWHSPLEYAFTVRVIEIYALRGRVVDEGMNRIKARAARVRSRLLLDVQAWSLAEEIITRLPGATFPRK